MAEIFYIGRIGLHDDEYEPVLIDWRARAARPFTRPRRMIQSACSAGAISIPAAAPWSESTMRYSTSAR